MRSEIAVPGAIDWKLVPCKDSDLADPGNKPGTHLDCAAELVEGMHDADRAFDPENPSASATVINFTTSA
jgi:hypothetical protein